MMMYVSWRKTLLVFIGVVVFSISYYFGVSYKAAVAPNGDVLLNGDFGIRAFSEGHRLMVKSKEEKESYGVIDQVYSLSIRSEDRKTVGQAVVTLRKLPTQDLFVFVHLDSKSDVQLTLEQSFDALSFTKIEETP